MRPTVRRRIIWAALIGVVLIATAISLLIYADTFDLGEHAGRCATSQWWAYIGCAMAAHEDLAAGLFGGAGALFAAWLAWEAVQAQLGEERDRRRRQQVEAKAAAVTIITDVIKGAATLLKMFETALNADEPQQGKVDQTIEQLVEQIRLVVDSFMVRESARDLGARDRMLYLGIVGTLYAVGNFNARPMQVFDRKARLEIQRDTLTALYDDVLQFDAGLGDTFKQVKGHE